MEKIYKEIEKNKVNTVSIEENIKELKKYNNYYLAKTLITAHNDIELLGSISEKMQEKYKELYNLVYNIMKNDREDIEELFNAEQKKAIKNLIKT